MTREAGTASIELVAGIGLLVVPVALLVLSLPVWLEVQSMGRVAAREAARVAVTSGHPAAFEAAAEAARTVARNHGRELAAPPTFRGGVVTVEGPAGPATQQVVTVTVVVRLPALALPWVGEVAAVDWSVSHDEPVDRYRSVP